MLIKHDVCVNLLTDFYMLDAVEVCDRFAVQINFQVAFNFVGVASQKFDRVSHYATTSLSGFDFFSNNLTILSREFVKPLTFATRFTNVS